MVSQSSWSELKPETALKLLERATTVEDMLYVFHSILPHFILAIVKAEDDEVVKAEAIFYLGQIDEALTTLSKGFSVIARLHPVGLAEDRLFSFMKEHIASIIRDYADVKYWNKIGDAIIGLEFEASYLSSPVIHYILLADSKIKDLLEKERSATAEA
ncbi:MAG: hypothetical protein RXO54_08115 [Acidilobus sp.]